MVYKKLNSAIFLTPKLLYIAVNIEYFLFYNLRQTFLTTRGVTGTQQTLTLIVMLLSTFFSNMGIAYLADKFQRPKGILIFCLLFSSLLFQILLLPIPSILISAVFVLYSMFILSTLPLLDRLVLDYLQKVLQAPASLYGRQRMFGTLTYALINYFTESIVFGSGGKSSKEGNYSRLCIPYILCASVASGLVLLLAPADRVRNAQSSSSSSRNPPQFSKVLKNPAYMFFLLIILMNGITRGVMSMYLSNYYKNILNFVDFKPPKYLPTYVQWCLQELYANPMSTCSTFGILLEIGLFFCSKPLLNMFGLYWSFLLSQTAQGLRFFLYTFIKVDDPYRFEKCCMIELLKGVNFGLTHLSGVQLATLLVPSNLKSTSQMIYTGTFVCLGTVAGVIAGHFLKIDTYEGVQMVFNGCAYLSLIAIGLIVLKYGFIDGKLWGENRNEVPAPPLSAQTTHSTLASQDLDKKELTPAN
ncbi:hypothetical protein NEPAR06_1150 [Nematocida parisii]|uniref:Major facilitator superfamily associated domain-containing protein n=1 Tax=Nematocida parisii (strain ERTm3) TaxID=935791 RepID=I3EKL6_NEMP3|nr:uncharacterized protein NEPG_00699 [Nematocida parisii ERTm1]EIJ89763.1 hypothetical protein NEQG_00533 [Nematocida parisii ERTm3]KAI5128516.1 hypothetical protein NEPAR08_1274 [Nematocida parisii]EIJ94034.1 hypothetical protein NEPG_00699 [Nematocida parisii ERTm1]KAI5128599.1 hypothetical protein NEPAR03_1406 [Nematocida parisii]KAI5141896.1 hypothetical protein NEPAR04_1279 [Nematocida parisii]|eukprot:XP_013058530.1 hypothetical protein NEPG_00699 [Nematocida parisii ERTm1]